MPATVIAERIGWTRGLTVFKERVAELRPVYLPPDPAGRTTYVAGEIAQCDLWFPPIHLPVGFGQVRRPALLPVLTMITGYSRWLSAMLIPTRSAADLFAGWWQLIEKLGAVPRVLVWDGEGAIGRWRGGKVELTGECQAFRGTLGAKVLVCKPGDPEAKGLIERCHDYLERSFLPGRVFASPADFNGQLQQWISVVNTRQRRALGCAPTDRIVADRHAMLALPPVAPVSGRRLATRLARDHYVRLDSNDYSVHPSVIGRRIEVIADLERVRVLCEGRVVADHERIWAWHQTISDPDHVAAARTLRRERVAVLRPVAELDVEQRPRSDYDTALGPRRPRRRGGVMPTRPATAAKAVRDLSAEVAFLTRALKAPTLRESVARLAERARAESWSHEEFLVACLQREVSARESHGGEGRIRAARFPARKSLDEFDFEHARGLKRDLVAHLGTLDFVVAKDNVVFLGPPGAG
jgi:transposase